MGGACNTIHGGNTKRIQDFSSNLKGREHLGGLDADVKITLRWLLKEQDMRLVLYSSDII